MVSTFTTNKGLIKPANGDDIDTWDVPVNADWDITDKALGGSLVINVVAVSGTVALTLTQYQNLTITFSGLLTSNVNYQLPSGVGGNFYFFNNTTGAFTVTISSAGAGSSVVLPQGRVANAICDGTNVVFPNAPTNPGGTNTQVQYNSNGLLAGNAGFTYNGTNATIGTVSAPGALTVVGNAFLGGTTSGFVGFTVPAVSGSTTYTLPASDGTLNQTLTTNGSGILSWATVAGGVTTFSGGTTGFTPNSATAGAITLGGTLGTANGGTNLTTFTAANNALYSTSASVLVAGTLPVAAGGTGATSITGVVIGNGTSAFTVKTNPSGAFVGTTDSQTLTNKTESGAVFNADCTVNDTGTIATNSVGFREIPQNSQGGAYQLVLTDNGKHVFAGGTITIPANASVAFPLGAAVVLVNASGSSTQTISITSDTLVQAGTPNTGSRTLAVNGVASIIKVNTTAWLITGNVT